MTETNDPGDVSLKLFENVNENLKKKETEMTEI